jgi:hypothetical protein
MTKTHALLVTLLAILLFAAGCSDWGRDKCPVEVGDRVTYKESQGRDELYEVKVVYWPTQRCKVSLIHLETGAQIDGVPGDVLEKVEDE